jgi:hypothetical protein
MSAPHHCPIALSLFLPSTQPLPPGPTRQPHSPRHPVAHASRLPLFARQRRRPQPIIEGHCRPPHATDHHARAPLSSFSRLHVDTPTLTPLSSAPCHRAAFQKRRSPPRAPFLPILLTSTPKPPEPSAASLSRHPRSFPEHRHPIIH